MTTKITQGNLERGEMGVGNVNPAMVRIRATEIAVADGRTEDEVSQQDLDQAENELRADLRSTERKNTSLDPTRGDDTDQSRSEVLVEQGIEEAAHDEAVESNRDLVDEAEEDEESTGR